MFKSKAKFKSKIEFMAVEDKSGIKPVVCRAKSSKADPTELTLYCLYYNR